MENKKLILTNVGKDDFGWFIFKDSEGNFFKGEVECGELVLFTTSGLNGDIDTPIERIEKYKNTIIEVDSYECFEPEDKGLRFRYTMLSRLKADCDYYLGNGNRKKKHLWAEDEEKQITEMKKLYNSFKESEKPEWLSYEEILDYEKKMLKF